MVHLVWLTAGTEVWCGQTPPVKVGQTASLTDRQTDK